MELINFFMATYNNLPVYKASYDMLLEIFVFGKGNINIRFFLLKARLIPIPIIH